MSGSRCMSGLLPKILEPLANLPRSPKEVGLDRSAVEAGDSGNLRNRELLEMLQDENRALAGRKRFHRRAQSIPNLSRHRAALRGRIRMGRELMWSRLLFAARRRLMEVEDEAAALEPVLAPVDADPRQPGFEGRAFPEVVQVLVCLQEALLGGAVRLPGVPQQAVGHPGDLAVVAMDEILEGLGTPGPNLFDQSTLVDSGISLAGDHREFRHIR